MLFCRANRNSTQRWVPISKLTNFYPSGTAAASSSSGSPNNSCAPSLNNCLGNLLGPNPVAERIKKNMEQIAIASSCVVSGGGVSGPRTENQHKLMSRVMQLAKTFNSFFLNSKFCSFDIFG